MTMPTASPHRSTRPPLRFTRRGRVVVTLMLATLALLAFSLGRASSDAATTPPSLRPVTIVQSGETLWSIARRVAPRVDPRITVARLVELNDLDGAVQPGQRLVLPR